MKEDKWNLEEEAPRASKKRKRDNPLAKARGKQQSHENIWFRRMGVGYNLFVHYYAGQPIGTVVDNGSVLTPALEKATTLDKKSVALVGKQGSGQSRASKRRRKMKRQQRGPNQQEQIGKLESPKEVQMPLGDESLKQHKLWQAFSSLQQHQPEITLLRPFIASLSQRLPVTFRIRRTVPLDELVRLKKEISSKFGHLVAERPFDEDLGRIYQATSGALCKESLGKVSPTLREFLIQHSQDGTLARQELGSMLPVLALEKSGAFDACVRRRKRTKCRVLDICASPGSKTLQALELFHAPEAPGERPIVSGMVVANDVSASRLETLQDAVQRSGLPPNLLEGKHLKYTCQDAQHWTNTGSSSKQRPWQVIICDVPCSGDGTIRKDPQVLPMWKPSIGNALHATQLAILKRSLHLIAVGGIVCYSTCSLNPVEDEAVVAAALSHFNAAIFQSQRDGRGEAYQGKPKPAVELVEFPLLPGFIRRPGISTWKVANFNHEDASEVEDASKQSMVLEDEATNDEIPSLHWYATYSDALAAKMDHAVPSLWPPSASAFDNEHVDGLRNSCGDNSCTDDPALLRLERCARLWPQDHDSGGFFVALIRKNR